MGKFRTNLKGQTGQSKTKPWTKGQRGQSSNSNFRTNSYNSQAKFRILKKKHGSTNKPKAALQKRDGSQTKATIKQPPTTTEDLKSDSGYSSAALYQNMRIFASDWTDITMSFNRFVHVFHSDSALHKEMLAIFAAITEVIKDDNGSVTATDYYCALVTTLEQIMEADEKNEDQIKAVLSLINMGIKKVPTAVLQQSYDSVSSNMLQVLEEFSSEDNVIVKSMMGILAVLLKVQELGMWQNLETQKLFAALLNPFCIHSKPKFRKAAQHAVTSILTSEIFQNDEYSSPAADAVALFCKETLESCVGSDNELASSIEAEQTTILHSLALLKDTIVYFSKSQVKQICKTVLRIMSLNYPFVTLGGMQVLQALLSAQKVVASAKLNMLIITALYDLKPADDAQPMLAWLAVMQQAHVHLANVELNQCATVLPKIFNTITKLWLSQKSDIVKGATESLEVLFRDAVSQICANADVLKADSKLTKCIHSVTIRLGPQCNDTLPHVLQVASAMFEVCGATCPHLLLNTLKTLSELRAHKFSYNVELERAVGAAVKSMGPEAVLNVISLRKDNQELNLDRLWLLPVLQENVHRATLEFWVRVILPLAIQSRKRFAEMQLWNLLPSFCNQPTDIPTGFKDIAKVLGMALTDRKELRLTVMAGLTKLIHSASENEEDIQEIARFDKNFLSILFNIYTTKPVKSHEKGQRLAALDTIKVFLPIARAEFTESLFSSTLERLETLDSDSSEDENAFLKESIMDLIKAMLPHQKCENIEKIFDMYIKHLADINAPKEQSVSYSLLEEICGSSSDGCEAFLKKHCKFVQFVLIKALPSLVGGSKGARLRCLNYLVKGQDQLDQDSILIQSTVPEAVLGCKDHNQECRLVSYEMLNYMGDILLKQDQMQEYVTMLLNGLTGTPQLISATLLAVSSVLHKFAESLGEQNIEMILKNVLQLMSVPTQEVVGSCLSFLKVFMTSLSMPLVQAQLGNIIRGLCSMIEDNHRHYRIKVRDILRTLVKKFGNDKISRLVPRNDAMMNKRLGNLGKGQKSHKQQDEEDDIMDIEEEFMINAGDKTEDVIANSDSDLDIDESEGDKGSAKKKFARAMSDSGSDESDAEIERDRKRKRSDVSGVASSFQGKYRTGASSFHRPTARGGGRSQAGSSRGRAGSAKSFASFGREYKSKKTEGYGNKKNSAYKGPQRDSPSKWNKSKNPGQFKNNIGAPRTGSKKRFGK